ncbi:hypothetical protein MICA_2144 [Micavibrio aeruginosavorus ARL-13]|uniref:Uncharacterized protein n=1 Tax=Micavibrio aeruginosavorus (strain ARL-13) TaxID=856793 RepID=G2KQX3_MICAA|nr:hypothetical protein MICA_2144 [Micavibrio aeruginosavorus ARL-13]
MGGYMADGGGQVKRFFHRNTPRPSGNEEIVMKKFSGVL